MTACPVSDLQRDSGQHHSDICSAVSLSQCRQRFGFPWRFGLSGGWFGFTAHVVACGCGVLAASCPGGLDHNFQRMLGAPVQDLRQQEDTAVGTNSVKGAEDHPGRILKYDDLFQKKEEDASALEDAEIPAAHLKRRPECDLELLEATQHTGRGVGAPLRVRARARVSSGVQRAQGGGRALRGDTRAKGAFGAVQVRVYEGDNKAFTAPHSDTVVGVDKEGNLLAEIDHVRACPGRHDLCPQPSKHRHAAAATCARSPPHTRVWPLSADREHGRGDLHDRRPDASVAEGGSTRPVPASRGFTLWCRSRTATSSFGRQALERTTGSSSTGFIGTAWSTSRGTRASRGPARRPAPH
eukprot:scaffold45672_cov69-Phaeocystis_antarctica.AAC.4